IDKREHRVLGQLDNVLIFPAKHFLTTQEKRDAAIHQIKLDLEKDAAQMQNPLYRERLLTRVNHDIEMLIETGYCTGIENYSRYFDGRKPGETPYGLF